jgi:hypothetical protein
MNYLSAIFTVLSFLLAMGCDQKNDDLLDAGEGTIEQQEDYSQDDFKEDRNFPIGPTPDTDIP